MEGSLIGGRYQVERRLGAGGVAQVFRAHDVQTNAVVAVKSLLPQHAADTLLHARFLREGTLGLAHPNILPVWDRGEQDGLPYFVTPLAEGGDLQGLLAAPRVQPSCGLARVVGAALASALAHAHAARVLHGDLKPNNVLLKRNGGEVVDPEDLWLADFGSARTAALATMTGASLQWGSAAYLAPECLQGQRPEPRSDLFSLGVILYQLMTGHLPWKTEAPLGRLRQPSPEPFDVDDERLESLVMALLSWDAADRPSSAIEVLRCLEGERSLQRPVVRGVCQRCGASQPADVPVCVACGHEDLPGIILTGGRWHVILRRLDSDPERLERLHALISRFSGQDRVSLLLLEEGKGREDDHRVGTLARSMRLPAALFASLNKPVACSIAEAFRAEGFDVVARRPVFPSRPVAAGVCVPLGMSVWLLFANIRVPTWPTWISPGVIGIGVLLAAVWRPKARWLWAPKSPLFMLRRTGVLRPSLVFAFERLRSVRNLMSSDATKRLLDDLGAAIYRLGARAHADDVAREVGRTFDSWVEGTLSWLEALGPRLAEVEAQLEATREADIARAHGKAKRRLSTASEGEKAALTAALVEWESTLSKRHDLEHERERLTAELYRVLDGTRAADGT